MRPVARGKTASAAAGTPPLADDDPAVADDEPLAELPPGTGDLRCPAGLDHPSHTADGDDQLAAGRGDGAVRRLGLTGALKLPRGHPDDDRCEEREAEEAGMAADARSR